MSVMFSLEYTERFDDKGGIGEIVDFCPNRVFKRDWKKVPMKDGRFRFRLSEGKVYYIKQPHNGRKYYVKIVDSTMQEINENDVKNYLHNLNKNEPKNRRVGNNGKQLSEDMEFLLVHLQEAVKVHQNEGKSIAKGMAYILSKKAELKGLTKEFLFIRDAIKDGKSEEDIRKELLGKNDTEKNKSDLSKFDNFF